MKKFLLLAFCLLFGFTTTTTLADDAVVTTPASADFESASYEVNTLEWNIFGGPAMITIAGGSFGAYGSGSISVSGLTAREVYVEAGDGYILVSSSVYAAGDRIIVYAEVRIPDFES